MPALAEGTTIERLQQLHYDTIGAEYAAHYGDSYSRQYRDRFIHEPMFAGVALATMNVLEAMCGDGQTTQYLLAKNATVTGLDISSNEISSFSDRWPKCRARCASIFDTGFPSESFDCVAIVGGLHHLHPNVHEALREVHRILRPEGFFCFAEPHRHSVPDAVRSFWYKHDRLFADNEASIDLDAMERDASSLFSFHRKTFLGNVAYLFVLNSMVFRIPIATKRFYAPAAMAVESFLNRILGRRTSCFVICHWQKR